MTLETVARKSGLGTAVVAAATSDRVASRWIAALLALYVVSFALFYPTTVTNTDETGYLNQARMMLRGSFTMTRLDPVSGEDVVFRPGTYPPGTAILMAPLISAFGWRGAYIVPLVSLLLAVVVTARWLRDEHRSALFSLVTLAFLPALVMGRLAMSDVPSMAVVALGLWLFWRGLDRGPAWWLAAGFVAGASLVLRPTNPMPFIPLFAGTVVRRETRCWALVVGGIAGVAVDLAVMNWVFGDPFYRRDIYVPDLGELHIRLLLYTLGLVVLVPGGLLFTLAYRGRRRAEIVASFVLFVGLYLAQFYSTQGTGPIKRMILALRYLAPIIPLVAFAMSESVPRLWRELLERLSGEARARLERRGRTAVTAALVLLAVACAAVHPIFAAWASTQAEIRDEIRRLVPVDHVLITNFSATRKFLPEIDQKFEHLDRFTFSASDVPGVVAAHGDVFVVLLDRTDSESWRQDAKANADFAAAMFPSPRLLLDRQMSSTDRLRIWELTLPQESSPQP